MKQLLGAEHGKRAIQMDYSLETLGYRYDYTTCMMMKLGMAHPERKGTGSHVLMTFEQALDVIRQIDAVTQGITKIYYLVGWQYRGHDDKYPDFFEVNEALKRPADETARDSFLWLSEQAKQYHSVISVHINFNDAYEDAPSFSVFREKGALIRKKDGTAHAIERYNGKSCYKTCLKTYWESGLFTQQFDRLLETLPFLQESGTVHVDNFQCYHNYSPDVTIREMQDARRKMVAYVKEKGIDITSEFTYKEDESLPNKKLFGMSREHHFKTPIDTLGEIPASWWCTRMTREEYVKIPPQLYGGGIYKDKRYANYLYGNMHGEDVIHPDQADWISNFLHAFATVQAPYHFLCRHRRLAIEGHGRNERCVFSDDIVSHNRDRKIVWGGDVMKERDTLFLPLVQKPKHWLAYSKEGDSRNWAVKEADVKKAEIYRITPQGNQFLRELQLNGGSLALQIGGGEALLVVFQ